MTSTTPTDRARARVANHPWLVALALLLLAIIVLIALWDWNWFKGPVERQVQARTGRSFDIGGDLDVDLGRITTIRADALRFGNAPWSKYRPWPAPITWSSRSKCGRCCCTARC